MARQHYTTGEVAAICGISQQTVVNYCNNGRIKAEQSPITRYRRITRKALIAFMRENGLPVARLKEFEMSQCVKGRRTGSGG